MKNIFVLVAVAAAIGASPVAAARHVEFTGVFSEGPYPTLSGTVDYDLVNNDFTLLGGGLILGSRTSPTYGFDFHTNLVVIRGGSAFDNWGVILDLDSTGLAYDDGDLGIFYRLSGGSREYDSDSFQFNPQTGAVPEPATWAMMLVGFGAVGYGIRRKRTQLRVTSA